MATIHGAKKKAKRRGRFKLLPGVVACSEESLNCTQSHERAAYKQGSGMQEDKTFLRGKPDLSEISETDALS